MRKATAALCACVISIGGAGAAVAHTSSTPTNIVFVGTDREPTDTYRAYGDLQTSKRCRANRRVEIYFDYVPSGRGPAPRDWTLVDIDRSSRNGMFAGSGPIGGSKGGVDAVRFRASRKKVGPAGHRHVCKAGTKTQPLA